MTNKQNKSNKWPLKNHLIVSGLLVLLFAVIVIVIFDNQPETQKIPDSSQKSNNGIKGLGYVSQSRLGTTMTGVSVYSQTEVDSGYNLYISAHAPSAYLINMKGTVLHHWKYPYDQAFPDTKPEDFIETFDDRRAREASTFWREVHLLPDGGLLAIYGVGGLINISSTSKLRWKKPLDTHHDLEIAENGNIYVLTRKRKLKTWLKRPAKVPVLDERVSIVSSSGTVLKKISILDAILNSKYSGIIQNLNNVPELLHSNDLELIKTEHSESPAAFKPGNLIISLDFLNSIIVLNPESERVVWASTGLSNSQHDVELLDDHDVLFFDNNSEGKRRLGESSLLRIDPATRRIVRRYQGRPDEKFYSECCSEIQKLTNDNVLITLTDPGRALEVTSEGKIVWEFHNPNRKDNKAYRLFELNRIKVERVQPWLPAGS